MTYHQLLQVIKLFQTQSIFASKFDQVSIRKIGIWMVLFAAAPGM
jgi:hypothetical protein